MLSAALENAVIQQIKLHSGSFPVYDKKNVITFNDLVVPTDQWSN
jgi:hypothetical protein